MDIRGRSNYPFRAPLTGPRIIPPSGRPCVGLTRLSSDRVAERLWGRVVEAREGTDSAERRARGRTEGEAASVRARRGRAVGPEGRQQAAGAGGRAENGGWKSEAAAAAAATREGGRGVGKTRSRGLLQSLRGQRESAAPAARSLARPSSSSSSTSSRPRYAHTCATTSCTHARAYTSAGRAACNSARTHVCTPRSAETAGTVGRGSASPRIASLSPLLLYASSPFPPCLPFRLFYLCFFYPSSLAGLTAGEGDKEATVMKSFRDLQSAAPVPSWRAELSVARICTAKRVE